MPENPGSDLALNVESTGSRVVLDDVAGLVVDGVLKGANRGDPGNREDRAPGFSETLRGSGVPRLRRGRTTTLQINVGRRCNQACHHCHVEAGPNRTEVMSPETADQVVRLLEASPEVDTVDITGGAPELNPSFVHLVQSARASGRHVIDRCNLTVLFEEQMEHLPRLFVENQVEVVASLPCYTPDNVDQQRGRGVFDKSIRALVALNELGYGRAGTGLTLNLVYNPGGAFLPPSQVELEQDYKRELREQFGLEFNSLLTITNMPIKRFAHWLRRTGRQREYMGLLVNHFNPATVPGLMCRSLLSVGWDGRLYDCDFNQMLDIGLGAGEEPAAGAAPRTVRDLESAAELNDAPIAVAPHCFGCTAGAGSSCGGALG